MQLRQVTQFSSVICRLLSSLYHQGSLEGSDGIMVSTFHGLVVLLGQCLDLSLPLAELIMTFLDFCFLSIPAGVANTARCS